MKRIDPTPAFTAYGRLMASIASFEQVLRLVLGEYEIRQGKLSADADEQTRHRTVKKIMTLDFGGLIQQSCDKLKIRAEVRTALKEAKGQRNHFAHNFWSANFTNLHSITGIELIVRHCAVMERCFQRLAQGIIEETGVDVARYVEYVRGKAGSAADLADYELHIRAVETEEDVVRTSYPPRYPNVEKLIPKIS